jgi:uncharacterized membrane protein YgcG
VTACALALTLPPPAAISCSCCLPAQVLAVLPATIDIPPMRGAELVSALVDRTEFAGGPACREFFRSRARWVVLEYLQECTDARHRASTLDVPSLVRMGVTVLASSVEQANKPEEILFRRAQVDRVEDGRRALTGGDLVQITFLAEAAAAAAGSGGGGGGAGGGGTSSGFGGGFSGGSSALLGGASRPQSSWECR